MKALHLFDFYLPSTLSWVARLLDRLADVEVEVAAPWIVRNQFYYPQFQYHTFPPQRWLFPKLVSEFAYPQGQRLFMASQRYIPTYPAWLYSRLKHNPPDLLHAHFGPTGCLYLPLAQKLARPLAVTFYGFDYVKLPNRHPVFKEKYLKLFRAAAQVIAASEEGCAALAAMGCPEGKLAIVRPSPQLDKFPFQKREKPAGRLRLVQVATVTPKKGHETSLEALLLALPCCPGLHLTLAGERTDKALTERLRSFIRANRLESRVTWLDFVDHRDMPEFLGQFDAFLHPSCHAPDGDHEATPVVLLEAQATGLPVLATRHFDLHREVIHGHTGLLSPEGDASALARNIEQFYGMENDDYQEFSKNARRHVEQNFDVKSSAAQLRNLYQNITST